MEEKIPAIRFKGFNGTWQESKLFSMCDMFTDGDWIEAQDQSDSGIRLIQTGNVGVTEYLDKPNNKKWISKDTFEALHCEEVFPGDILISRLPEPAGRACIVPELGTKMITAVDCTIVRPSNNTSRDFLVQYLSSQQYFNKVNTCLAGGTRQRISRSNLAYFDIPTPINKDEQQKIGMLFSRLDTLITLTQQKLDKLKTLKKSCLEKMFPKDGETVPEIRFKGFEGPWEKRNLGDSLTLLKDGTHGTHQDSEDGALLLSAKNIKNGRVFWDDSDRRISYTEYERIFTTYQLKEGDILLTIVGSIGETAIIHQTEGIAFQRSVAFLRPNKELTSSFLLSEIQNRSFQQEMDNRKSTSAQPGIYLGDLANIPITFPRNIKEQIAIGEFFSKMNIRITLQQQKLEKLKDLKKALLDKMFV